MSDCQNRSCCGKYLCYPGHQAVFFLPAIAGWATLWMAVFADRGASLLVVFNGLRILRRKT